MKKIFLPILIGLTVLSCQPHIKPVGKTPAPTIRVLLGIISSSDSLQLHGKYVLTSEEAKYELGAKNKELVLHYKPAGYRLTTVYRLFSFTKSDRIQLQPSAIKKHYFTFRNHSYPGRLVITSSSNGLKLINYVDLETYLKHVVPAEIPSHTQKYFEALKAQAITARTYALERIADRSHRDFDVYNDQRDQVYTGIKSQSELADQAVRQTRGVVLMFNDSLAHVFFHSTCGGISAAPQEVWPGIHATYLKSKEDVLGKEFTCAESPYFRWQQWYTLSQFDSLFVNRFHRSFLHRTVQDTTRLNLSLRIADRTVSGRVKTMQVTYGDTTFTLQGYQIRSFFGNSRGASLPSTLFYLKPSFADSAFCICGGGYGHGVGLCQWGALHMAEKGFKYFDILVNKYFPGTYLKKAY